MIWTGLILAHNIIGELLGMRQWTFGPIDHIKSLVWFREKCWLYECRLVPFVRAKDTHWSMIVIYRCRIRNEFKGGIMLVHAAFNCVPSQCGSYIPFIQVRILWSCVQALFTSTGRFYGPIANIHVRQMV